MAYSKSLKKSDRPTHGGYDYEFVDTIPTKYICSICTKALCDPHLTECCGQNFCASCLTHWLGTRKNRKTCPHCREINFLHIINKEKVREMNELKIYCTNHKKGCGWVGEVQGVKSHLGSDKGCDYVKVTCTNYGCEKSVRRKDLQTHLKNKCFYRPYKCEHCGKKGTYVSIACHYEECLEYPLDCPNKCGVTGMKRQDMSDHRSSCPMERLDCPFEHAGCDEGITRKDIEDHMAAYQEKHIQMSFQSLQKCTQKLEGLKKEIEHFEEYSTSTHESTLQFLSLMKSILKVSLRNIGDTLTFRLPRFNEMRWKEWQSPSFSINDDVTVHLGVHGVGSLRRSHVSVSLVLMEARDPTDVSLPYTLSVSIIGKHTSVTRNKIKLCCVTKGRNSILSSVHDPSPGTVLWSEKLPLEMERANSFVVDDSLILKVELLRHYCYEC